MVRNNNYKSNKKLNNLKINKSSKILFSNNKSFMNAGIYIFKKKVLNQFKIKKNSLEDDLLPLLIKKNLVEGYISKNDFIDIGLKKNLNKTSEFLNKNFKHKGSFIW